MQMIDKTVICCEHVTKSYLEGERQRIVLRDITFQVQAGELIVLLGKSGSGKSTLLNLVSGIDTPDTGAIWVAGQRLISCVSGSAPSFVVAQLASYSSFIILRLRSPRWRMYCCPSN